MSKGKARKPLVKPRFSGNLWYSRRENVTNYGIQSNSSLVKFLWSNQRPSFSKITNITAELLNMPCYQKDPGTIPGILYCSAQ